MPSDAVEKGRPGLGASKTGDTSLAFVADWCHLPSHVGTQNNKNSASTVPTIALRSWRLIEETNMPAARETKSRFTSARIVRQNSPAVTPPNSSDVARIGNAASKP